MYVVQPSFSQKCVACACLRGVSRGRGVRGEGGGLRDAVAEPGVRELVHDDVDQRAVAGEKGYSRASG